MASDPGSGSANNPNGVWTYGQYTSNTIEPASFAAYTSSNLATGIYAGLYQWKGSNSDPNIVYNSNSTDVLPGSGTGNIDFKAHEVTFGPYDGPDVARFTAPTTDSYLLSAFFQTVQESNSNPTTEILVAGTPVFTNTDEDSIGSSYNNVLALTAGETVDLLVTTGISGMSPKTTLVTASFTAVTEPSSITLALLGTVAMLGIRFIHRRCVFQRVWRSQ
jgi:hypothetical protein